MSPQAREVIEWIGSLEVPIDPGWAKAEIQRRWGMDVWSEVIGFSLACVIRDTTEQLLKEHMDSTDNEGYGRRRGGRQESNEVIPGSSYGRRPAEVLAR